MGLFGRIDLCESDDHLRPVRTSELDRVTVADPDDQAVNGTKVVYSLPD